MKIAIDAVESWPEYIFTQVPDDEKDTGVEVSEEFYNWAAKVSEDYSELQGQLRKLYKR